MPWLLKIILQWVPWKGFFSRRARSLNVHSISLQLRDSHWDSLLAYDKNKERTGKVVGRGSRKGKRNG